MPYDRITLAQFRKELLDAMHGGDGGPGSFWSTLHVNYAISEALYLWGLFTQYWRDRGIFTTTPGEPSYNLAAQLPTLRPRTSTFNLIAVSQLQLCEEPTLVGGSSSAQFPTSTLVAAMLRKHNEFILDARLPTARANGLAISPDGRVQLPTRVAGIVRVSYRDALTGIYKTLRRENAYSMDSASHSWTLSPSSPYAYSAAETAPIALQLYPAPLATGTVDILYLPTLETPLNLVTNDTKFYLPNEYRDALTYGTLASVLSTQNEGFDPTRAKYCLERYKQIVQFASQLSSILRVRVNDKPVSLDTLANLDNLRPYWRNQPGRPDFAACGFDILHLSRVPDSTYGVTCDVVRSAPIPASDGDFLQVGTEELPYLFNYCRHFLSFKLGGTEFTSTMPLLDDFLSGCQQRAGLVKIQATRNYTSLFGQPAKELAHAPVA